MRRPFTAARPLALLALPVLIALAITGFFGGHNGGVSPNPAAAATQPTDSLVNFETPHVHPIDLTPDGRTLLAVNTAAARLEVFDVTSGSPIATASIPVGLDPVTVRARSNTEAWVVNHLSDSVSVVDLRANAVVDTKLTGNEPADVAFAGSPERAFVTASEANRVEVFFPDADDDSPSATINIAGEDPRGLAVSPDGRFVYAAIFESGNQTTIVPGHDTSLQVNVVSRPEGPYRGVNPPPNSGNSFSPPIASRAGTPAETSMIVRENTAGRWLDDNGRDWSIFIDGSLAGLSERVPGWELFDHDVAVIDTTNLAVSYQDHLMNINMAIGVNPATGRISTVGTDSINEVRFEPNLNGRFSTVNIASFARGGGATVSDLNPHLDYSNPTVPPSVREQSIGDPRGIAWTADGTRAYVTGMGSNNVIVTDRFGNRLGRFDVGQGPTGIVLDDGSTRGYVLNKFDGSISVIDTAGNRVIGRTVFYDPTPQVIKDGRPFLYDTHLTSGTGHLSCATCHVDARTDRLAWDLGDPQGVPVQVPANNGQGGRSGSNVTVSPMKGALLTQTLQDISGFGSLHWRGDRSELADFNSTFVDLMGRPSQISGSEMARFDAFLGTIHLPPNPYRRIDNSRPNTVTLPNGQRVTSSSNSALDANCMSCHYGGSERPEGVNSELGQAFVPPSWAPWYDRLGYWPDSRTGSTTGFGYFHDGSSTLGRAARQDAFLAEILTLEGPGGHMRGGETRQDAHAGVGQQLTINGPITSAERSRLNQLTSIVDSSFFVSMTAALGQDGATTGFRYDGGGRWTGDRAGLSATTDGLVSIAAGGSPVTFTVVANGTQNRLGIDLDNDGTRNGDERSELRIDGTVTLVSGQPVGNVGVELFTARSDGSRGTWVESTTTNTDGSFRLTPPADACWVVTFVAPTGQTFVDSGSPWLNRFRCLSGGRATADATIAEANGGPTTIGGSVVSSDGAGFGGLAVDLFTSNPAGDRLSWVTFQRTGADGSFSFEIDAGCWALTYIAPANSRFDDGSAFRNHADCVDDGESAEAPVVTLVTDQDGAVTGTVTSGGVPVAGVAVDLFNAAADGSRAGYVESATTGTNGQYRFEPDPGCYVEVLIGPGGRRWVVSGTPWLQRFYCVTDGESVARPEALLQR